MVAADEGRVVPEHAHGPLVLMLVLTQLAAGAFVIDALILGAGGAPSALRCVLGLGFGLLGLAASLRHLGRPLYAYRALIGLKHSWLSREVAAFGLFAAVALFDAGLTIAAPDWLARQGSLAAALAAAVAFAGGVGVACSVMVYHVVRRPFWNGRSTAVKFAGTALILGIAVTLISLAFDNAPWPLVPALAGGLIITAVGKLALDAMVLLHYRDNELTPLRRSAMLVCGPLAVPAVVRVAAGLLGGVILPLSFVEAASALSPPWRAACWALALAILLGGEVAERYLFFAAVVRPKMPGGLLA
jgi:DMSO reductase anchor subunit